MRLPASVVLIGAVTATAKGEVSGTEHTRTWKITRRGSSTTFVNPLLELQPLNLAFKRRFPFSGFAASWSFPTAVQFKGEPPRALSAPPTSSKAWTRS